MRYCDLLDYLDDQNIFLRYTWSSATVPGSQLPNAWEFPKESNNDVPFYVNELTFGANPRKGAV